MLARGLRVSPWPPPGLGACSELGQPHCTKAVGVPMERTSPVSKSSLGALRQPPWHAGPGGADHTQPRDQTPAGLADEGGLGRQGSQGGAVPSP